MLLDNDVAVTYVAINADGVFGIESDHRSRTTQQAGLLG
jgi:hypothetical protein